MSHSARTLRHLAFQRQSGRCFYCHWPLWSSAAERLVFYSGVSNALSQRFQCTAEHLVPRSEGGRDAAENIVAACMFCNRTRHRVSKALTWRAYADRVARRVAAKRWHPWIQLKNCMESSP
jgi:5-methylcytosine-specific restriction endonuclease McrA